MDEAAKVFNRGFSDGFFMGKPVGDWTSDGNRATAKKRIVGHVEKFFPKISVAEISVDAAPVSVGDKIQIEGEKSGFVEMEIESMQIAANRLKRQKKASVSG